MVQPVTSRKEQEVQFIQQVTRSNRRRLQDQKRAQEQAQNREDAQTAKTLQRQESSRQQETQASGRTRQEADQKNHDQNRQPTTAPGGIRNSGNVLDLLA